MLKVMRAKDGWLFLDNDSNACLDQITGRRLLSDSELSRWEQITTTRNAEMEKRGIHHWFFVPPNKECLYPEYLPDGIEVSDNRPIGQLLGLTHPPIYLLDDLSANKEDGILLYSKKDTHWNHYGAFVGYERIAEVISKKVPIRQLTREDVTFSVVNVTESDLGSKIGEGEVTKVVANIANRSASLVFNNGISQTGNYRIYENNARPELPVCAMFCDSFSWDIRDFIAESFSKLYLVRLPHVDWGLVDKFKPDVVITELVERFLVRPSNDGTGTLKKLVLEKRAKANI